MFDVSRGATSITISGMVYVKEICCNVFGDHQDPTVTNREECIEYVVRAGGEADGLFAHQSEHVTLQIVTPKATIRLTHGRLHQVAMRDPTDQVDLPDHVTWQMNMGIEHSDINRVAKGILGETFVPTRDANGNPILSGMDSIRGKQEDCEFST